VSKGENKKINNPAFVKTLPAFTELATTRQKSSTQCKEHTIVTKILTPLLCRRFKYLSDWHMSIKKTGFTWCVSATSTPAASISHKCSDIQWTPIRLIFNLMDKICDIKQHIRMKVTAKQKAVWAAGKGFHF